MALQPESCRFARALRLVRTPTHCRNGSPTHFRTCSRSNFHLQFSALAHTQLFTPSSSMYIIIFKAVSRLPQVYPFDLLRSAQSGPGCAASCPAISRVNLKLAVQQAKTIPEGRIQDTVTDSVCLPFPLAEEIRRSRLTHACRCVG